jgi:PTH1 family peptidyl-tRNA hydrolase
MQDFDISKIKLIVALGNTGLQYTKTRHNAGFLFVDKLSNNFKEDKKFKAFVDTISLNDNKLVLAKPTTMMNLSGQATLNIKQFYKFRNNQILVAHDDLDIKVGDFKIQFAKGPRGHNGISSIEQMIGDNNFWRLRIGVENRSQEERKLFPGISYVLNQFSEEEFEILNLSFDKIISLLKNLP